MSIEALESKARGTRALADAYHRQAYALAVQAQDAEDRAHEAQAALEAAQAEQIPTVKVGDVIDLDYRKPELRFTGNPIQGYYNREVTAVRDDTILTEAEDDGAIRSFLKSRIDGEFVYDAYTGEPIRV